MEQAATLDTGKQSQPLYNSGLRLTRERNELPPAGPHRGTLIGYRVDCPEPGQVTWYFQDARKHPVPILYRTGTAAAPKNRLALLLGAFNVSLPKPGEEVDADALVGKACNFDAECVRHPITGNAEVVIYSFG